MIVQQYSVNQHPIQTLLTWIDSEEIAIPEIQRPFVWNSSKVRDLLDSLYHGFPIGYIITWRNPDIKLKDGSVAKGKRILIDGQQRITALIASIKGQTVIDKNYKANNIKIAFHPLEKRFEVSNPAIRKDKSWIPDISKIFAPDFRMLQMVDNYAEANGITDKDELHECIHSLKGILNNPVGLIELNADLPIEVVTEIFIRINSKGVVLSQADFAMSKIAVNDIYGGNLLRKAIDYFSHLAVAPEFYPELVKSDKDFTNTEYFNLMSWLKDENDDLYDPSYTDILRVGFTSEFQRGRLQDLVALLSGRNFETREYEEEIAEDSFSRLKEGVKNFMNKSNFNRFVMIIKSAGFIDKAMVRSQNALNFAYILYLFLRKEKIHPARIETLVKKWFVLSVLKSRYSSSPESQFDFDIKQLNRIGAEEYLQNVINAELSDAFWEFGLPQQLNTSVASSPTFNVYLAAQVRMNDKGFLSRDITVRELIMHKGDVHHLFPKQYLKNLGYTRSSYNQIANYVMTQSEINIAIGSKAPGIYLQEILHQCESKELKYGGINSLHELDENFRMNSVPMRLLDTESMSYEQFLEERRMLMALKIKKYFQEYLG